MSLPNQRESLFVIQSQLGITRTSSLYYERIFAIIPGDDQAGSQREELWTAYCGKADRHRRAGAGIAGSPRARLFPQQREQDFCDSKPISNNRLRFLMLHANLHNHGAGLVLVGNPYSLRTQPPSPGRPAIAPQL
jgi:hypothetical protein